MNYDRVISKVGKTYVCFHLTDYRKEFTSKRKAIYHFESIVQTMHALTYAYERECAILLDEHNNECRKAVLIVIDAAITFDNMMNYQPTAFSLQLVKLMDRIIDTVPAQLEETNALLSLLNKLKY